MSEIYCANCKFYDDKGHCAKPGGLLHGIQAIGSIIIGEIRQLEAIILQFAGEESIGGDNKFPTSLNPYIDTLVQYLLQSEMIELPSPIED